jgi:ABC-type glycerol-3-phosphate transport system substrate-binding protein
MTRKARLSCALLALVLALAAAAPASAGSKAGPDGLKFSVEILIW